MPTTIDTVRLTQICESSLETVGYELVEMEHVRDPSGWVLRIFIDHTYNPQANDPQANGPQAKPAQGSSISLQDCEIASRHIGTVLDVEDLIPHAYRLEVSSPGVRRPLRKERDFERFVGQQVRVQMSETWEGRRNFVGSLRLAGAGEVEVEVEGQVFKLPLQQIRRARLEVEL